MKYFLRTGCLFFVVVCMHSCGVVTKARYGNGWKLTIEPDVFRKGRVDQHTKETIGKKSAQARKTNHDTNLASLPGDHLVPVREEVLQPMAKIPHPAVNPPVAGKMNIFSPKFRNAFKKDPGVIGKRPTLVHYSDVPVEPTVKLAGYLFYGGLAGSFIPYVSAIAFLAILAGFILALIGLRRLKMYDYAYRGYGLAISIVVIFMLYLLALLFLIFLLFALIL